MLRRPPQHRADAEIIYVSPIDPAWRADAIVAERKALEEAGEDPAQHPASLYLSGSTRYDLHARLRWKGGEAPATDWLDLPSAYRFTLRRLPPRLFSRVHARRDAAARAGTVDYDASFDACKWALVRVEGPEPVKLSGSAELTEDDITELVACFGLAAVWALGDAAYYASIPLTEQEKKAFAS